jgi:hypothetical protein
MRERLLEFRGEGFGDWLPDRSFSDCPEILDHLIHHLPPQLTDFIPVLRIEVFFRLRCSFRIHGNLPGLPAVALPHRYPRLWTTENGPISFDICKSEDVRWRVSLAGKSLESQWGGEVSPHVDFGVGATYLPDMFFQKSGSFLSGRFWLLFCPARSLATQLEGRRSGP